MTTFIKPNLEQIIDSRQDLIAYLSRGAKPRETWGIGAEMEKLVVDADTGQAATYDRIRALLESLLADGAWIGIYEGPHLIALKDASSSVTLEPGGQLELSGALCADIHCCQQGFSRHIDDIIGAGRTLGLRFLGLGVQPFSRLEEIGWVPKARYDIMGPYMQRTGDMGQRMMKQSAGLQVNLDYSSEEDCFRKLRLAFQLSPLFYALFANSPLMDGRPSGFLSTRGEIWARTDADRSGLVPRLLLPGATFEDYADYALEVPMYFIIRDGKYVDLTPERFSFRRYLEEGFGPHRATLGDWDLHLSTLFPEARLRPQIEIRSADSLPSRMTLAVAALVKGLFYDDQAFADSQVLFARMDVDTLTSAYRQSWRLGLQTPFGAGTLQTLARDILTIARDSLRRQKALDENGQDETIYLQEVDEIALTGKTLAERLLERWQGSPADKLNALYAHCGF
ncbi:glutamate-cysteine ligase family protein [Desulfuromonas sp. KJ2020]|uniref:glutamate--cysteine ligase n=1 Tax=Desulfuromonas sp. KJ2020 TaxID=2919173 RepID=UPI0020A75C0D|nr:glutamate-cysteine ligase family protein [Desulfuromonas sp. KJ2020]MCP3176067.1 glutamate-cysteine ligase family protein [Desulfuromonas sp. KJ2020]